MNTNDATRATAEAMPEINRRRFLTGTAIAGAAVAVASPVVAAEPPRLLFEPLVLAEDRRRFDSIGHPKPTPIERFDAAVIELKRAVMAIDPSISDWDVSFAANDDLLFRFMAVASRKSVQEPSRKAGPGAQS